ncbi:MAG: hypothetical protein HC890_03030 [Chloroflexaceae bacterium]|nr:hypothetical protein [Chloroflexaceae bacterium]
MSIIGTIGNDELFAEGASELVLGLAGDDILDAVPGEGGNILLGGEGNDELLANINDQLFGQEGDDTLDARGGIGSNLLDGGEGRRHSLWGK